MIKVLAFVKVIPIGTSSSSLSSYVAEAIKVLNSMNIKYQLTPFGTAVEVDSIDRVADLLKELNRRFRDMGVPRLVIDVSLDLRYDKEITLEYKVSSVYEKL
ncbi:MAG: MTH1187 family thiamine-binding protein [Sulfolobales archaeon]